MKDSETHGSEKSEGYEEAAKKIQTILGELAEINHGERLLDSEYNEEWDDWYNSDADEVVFSDPDGILREIEDAIKTVHYCVDREMYKEGCELAEALSALEVCAKGDYNDFDGAPLSIGDLDEYDLLTSDYDEFAKDCLYLSYMGNRLDNRPEELFCMMENLVYPEVTLEDIMQMGNSDLPDFDEFLGMWIEYLGRQRGRSAERLLKEAQSMLKDDNILLENARKYVKEYPSLYKQILEIKLNTEENGKMFLVGMEALESIPISYVIRSDIALLTAEYAMRMGKQKDAEKCWVEAFRSDSTVMNYWRIRLLSGNWKEYRDEVQAMTNLFLQELLELWIIIAETIMANVLLILLHSGKSKNLWELEVRKR